MLDFYYKSIKDGEFQILDAYREGCWVHADQATPEDLNRLCELTGLDYTDLQDCLDKYEIPRIERVKNNVLIFLRIPSDNEVGFYTSMLAVLISPKYFITISPQRSYLVKSFISKQPPITTQDTSKLLLHLLIRMAQDFTTEIKKVRHNVLKQEKEIVDVDSDDISELTKNDEILNQYLSALTPTIKVLEAIASGKYTDLNEKEHPLLEDLLNAVKQSEDICSSNLKSIRSLRDSYQIISNAAKMHYMSGNRFSVPVVFRGPNGAAAQVSSQHSHCVETIYGNLPGLIIISPSNAYDAKGLLKSAIRDNNPVLYLENELIYGDKMEIPTEEYLVPIGKAKVVREGKHVTLVSYSRMIHLCKQASDELAKQGIQVELIDLRTIKPLDIATVAESVRKTHFCVLVEEGHYFSGICAEVGFEIQEHCFDFLDAPIKRVCQKETPMPYSKVLEKETMPTKEKIIQAILEIL